MDKMNPLSSLQIAQKALTPVSTILTNVAREKCDMDLIELGVSLCAFSLEIAGFTLAQRITFENDGRVDGALQSLENIISVSYSDRSTGICEGPWGYFIFKLKPLGRFP